MSAGRRSPSLTFIPLVKRGGTSEGLVSKGLTCVWDWSSCPVQEREKSGATGSSSSTGAPFVDYRNQGVAGSDDLSAHFRFLAELG